MTVESGLMLLVCTEPTACATVLLEYTQLLELDLGRNQGPMESMVWS